MSVLVIGESCLDVFKYGLSNRLCPEAPVPVFNTTAVVNNEGMAYNVYNNLVSLGTEAEILTNPNYKQITKTRFVDYRSNYMFLRLDENDGKYTKSILDGINFSRYDAIIVSDYDKGFLTERDIEYIGHAHPAVFLDTKKILGSWCNTVTYIKINENEYNETKHTLGTNLIEKVIITMGPRGAKHKGKVYPVPAVEIKDTSGAGDTFVASLTSEYIKSQDIEKAITFANECATTVVQKKGVAVV